ARAETDARAAQMIQALASRKGPLSDALTAAARRAADEKKYTKATDEFVGAVRSAIERGDFDGLSIGGAGRGDEAAGQNPPRAGGAAESPAGEQSLKLFDDPAGTGADLQARGLDADLRRSGGIDRTDAGDQQVIPGAEKISDKKLAERGAQGKLK